MNFLLISGLYLLGIALFVLLYRSADLFNQIIDGGER